MPVLVTGGAGYIGSHTCLALLEEGFEPIILDNFSNSKEAVLNQLALIAQCDISCYRGSTADIALLNQIFDQHDISAVLHFAAYKSVQESTEHPLRYYENNVANTLTLLECMRKRNIKQFVFSSSATIYGEPQSSPISEQALSQPVQPYGWSKQMIEHILHDLHAADPTWNCIILRYFNPVGAHLSGLIGEDPQGIPNNLTPYITQVAIGRRPHLSIFGQDYQTPDGTCLRDYIHIQDLAEGHAQALKIHQHHTGYHVYNLGTGQPSSVFEVLHAFELACGQKIPYVIAPRRSGDVPAYWADPSKAKKELNWQTQRSLNDMAVDCWRWQSTFPHGL